MLVARNAHLILVLTETLQPRINRGGIHLSLSVANTILSVWTYIPRGRLFDDDLRHRRSTREVAWCYVSVYRFAFAGI